MKNKMCLVLPVLALIVMLEACASTPEEAAVMGGDAVPETSAGELLADSLEYLLNEEELEIQEVELPVGEDVPEEEEKQPKVDVTIYYGNSASEELNMEVSAMEQVTAENLIDALVRHNIVSMGTKVNSFEEQEVDGVKMLHLDLSKSFREYLKTMTKEGENIIMSSMTATFLEAFDAEKMLITVDGAVLETEHAVYEEPIQYRPEHLLSPGK